MQIKYDKEADALYIRLLAGDYQCACSSHGRYRPDLAAGEQRLHRGAGASRLFENPEAPG